MLSCDLCEYFKLVKSEGGKVNFAVCEHTGFEFHKDIQDYDIEYPCSDFDINENLLEYEKYTA